MCQVGDWSGTGGLAVIVLSHGRRMPAGEVILTPRLLLNSLTDPSIDSLCVPAYGSRADPDGFREEAFAHEVVDVGAFEAGPALHLWEPNDPGFLVRVGEGIHCHVSLLGRYGARWMHGD